MARKVLTQLELPRDPVAALEAATKQYVDAAGGGGGGAADVVQVPVRLTPAMLTTNGASILDPQKPLGINANPYEWSNAFSDQVGNGPGSPNYQQYDMGEVKTLTGLVVAYYHGDVRSYEEVKYELSADGTTWVPVLDVTAVPALPGGVRLDWPAGKAARYLRLWCSGNTSNPGIHYVAVVPYSDGA